MSTDRRRSFDRRFIGTKERRVSRGTDNRFLMLFNRRKSINLDRRTDKIANRRTMFSIDRRTRQKIAKTSLMMQSLFIEVNRKVESDQGKKENFLIKNFWWMCFCEVFFVLYISW